MPTGNGAWIVPVKAQGGNSKKVDNLYSHEEPEGSLYDARY